MEQITESTSPADKVRPRLHIDGRFAALVISCGILFVYIFASARIQYDRIEGVDLDTAWLMSLAATWNQGDILGRDIFFTYGPLSQWIASLGPKWVGSSSAFNGIYVTHIILAGIGVLGIGIAITLMGLKHWRQTLVAFWAFCLVIFKDFVLVIRFLLPIIAAIALAHAIHTDKRSMRLVSVFLLGIASLLMQLFSADLGVYTVATGVIVIIFYTIYAWVRGPSQGSLLSAGEYLGMLCLFLGAYIAANIAVSILFQLTSTTYGGLFDYQRRTLEIIQGYNYSMAKTWGYTIWESLVLLAILFFVFSFLLIRLWGFSGIEQKLLVALAVCTVLMLKSALIRSDSLHIVWAVTGLIYLFVLIGVKYYQEIKFARYLWLLLLVGTLIWPTGYGRVLYRVPTVISQLISPWQTYLRMVSLRVEPQDILSAELLKIADPNKGMLNFPFENEIAIGLGRRLVAPVLQAYAATTLDMQQYYIRELERQKENIEILYALDNAQDVLLDRVDQVARVPIIFEYIVHNFEAKSPIVDGRVLLEARADERTDMHHDEVDLEGTLQRETNILTLAEPINCSLLKLNLEVSYPITSLLGRPNPLQIEVSNAGQSVAASNIVQLNAGGTFPVYIDLLQPEEFGEIFGTNPVPQHKVDGFTLTPRSTGLFGVNSDAVVIDSVDCVTFQR